MELDQQFIESDIMIKYKNKVLFLTDEDLDSMVKCKLSRWTFEIINISHFKRGIKEEFKLAHLVIYESKFYNNIRVMKNYYKNNEESILHAYREFNENYSSNN